MENFVLDLSSTIIHIEYQRKRLLENPDAKKKLCNCRIEILNNFSNVMQKLMIRLCARAIKYDEDQNLKKATAFEGLEEWFENEMYQKLYNNNAVSNKMIILFKLLQMEIDKEFFKKINKDLKKTLKKNVNTNVVRDELLEEVLDDIKKWFEMFILNILAIQINCKNIDNKIFVKNNIKNDESFCLDKVYGKNCEKCINRSGGNDNFCNICCNVHESVENSNEKVTLIITREMLKTPNWIENFFITFKEYHLNVDSVILRLDYRMFDINDPLIFSDECIRKFEIANKIFKNIQIKNYEGVVYGSYLENVKRYFTNCYQGA